jgi:hypothetical protein
MTFDAVSKLPWSREHVCTTSNRGPWLIFCEQRELKGLNTRLYVSMGRVHYLDRMCMHGLTCLRKAGQMELSEHSGRPSTASSDDKRNKLGPQFPRTGNSNNRLCINTRHQWRFSPFNSVWSFWIPQSLCKGEGFWGNWQKSTSTIVWASVLICLINCIITGEETLSTPLKTTK